MLKFEVFSQKFGSKKYQISLILVSLERSFNYLSFDTKNVKIDFSVQDLHA